MRSQTAASGEIEQQQIVRATAEEEASDFPPCGGAGRIEKRLDFVEAADCRIGENSGESGDVGVGLLERRKAWTVRAVAYEQCEFATHGFAGFASDGLAPRACNSS
jgi:hypothetical protein